MLTTKTLITVSPREENNINYSLIGKELLEELICVFGQPDMSPFSEHHHHVSVL